MLSAYLTLKFEKKIIVNMIHSDSVTSNTFGGYSRGVNVGGHS